MKSDKPEMMTTGQTKEAALAFGRVAPTDWTADQAARLINCQKLGDFVDWEGLRQFCSLTSDEEIRAHWQDFWSKLGLKTDLSQVVIPAHQADFDRVLIIARELWPNPLNQLWQMCLDRFDGQCWKYCGNDIDAAIPRHDRTAEKASYAIRVRGRQESDKELKNLSANQLKEQGLVVETAVERVIHELKFHDETGDHLDVSTATLAVGSRDSGGHVPYLDWDSEFYLSYYLPGHAFGNLGARAVVS